MANNQILRIVGKFLIPFILIFGLYVQFHGELGPGGGFQAGVIISTAFTIHALIFGIKDAAKIAPPKVLKYLSASGVLIYAGVGVASLLSGGNYLNYNVLSADPIIGQHVGIILVELGVGVTVASTMTLIFFAFALRGEEE